MRVYLNPPTETQSLNAMLMWTISRYFDGRQSIGLPLGVGMVVYEPRESGNLPELRRVPSLEVEMMCW